jgi:hypothetical protein
MDGPKMMSKRLREIVRRDLFLFARELVPLEAFWLTDSERIHFRRLAANVLRRKPYEREEIVRCAVVPHVIERYDPPEEGDDLNLACEEA